MSYLQLAEDNYSHLAQAMPTSASEMYVFIPQGYKGAQKDLYIREDLLDNVPEMVYQQMMFDLEPYQNTGMSAKADRDARKQARKDRKALKGETRDARQQARLDRAKSGETGLKTIISGAKDIVGGIFGTGTTGTDTTTTRDPLNFDANVSFGNEPTFFEQYRIPLILGGVAVGGLLIYKMMKKK
jgi:hypothetical protein